MCIHKPWAVLLCLTSCLMFLAGAACGGTERLPLVRAVGTSSTSTSSSLAPTTTTSVAPTTTSRAPQPPVPHHAVVTVAPVRTGGMVGGMAVGAGSHRERFRVTCYTEDGGTYSGTHTGPGQTAVDPRYVPLGSVITIDGMAAYSPTGTFKATDIGGAVKGYWLDVWMTPDECAKFGMDFRYASW